MINHNDLMIWYCRCVHHLSAVMTHMYCAFIECARKCKYCFIRKHDCMMNLVLHHLQLSMYRAALMMTHHFNACINRLITSSRVLEFKSSTRLVKTWFKSEFLTQVFKLSQKIQFEYLSWVRRLKLSIDSKFSIRLIKTWSKVLLIFIWISDNATE